MLDKLEIDFNELNTIESFCVNCEKQGVTRVLALKIPFFKEVMLLSFECPHCHHKSNELQPMAEIQEFGIRFELKVADQQDLDRMVVIQAKTMIYIPEIDFEIPCMKQGHVTTIQGLLQMFADDLSISQEERKISNPQIYEKIEEAINQLNSLQKLENKVFHVIVNDPSGNSFISNPNPQIADNHLKTIKFSQTKDDLYKLGYISDDDYEKYKQEKQETKDPNQVSLVPKERGLTDQEVSVIVGKMKHYNQKQGVKIDDSSNFNEEEVEQNIMHFPQNCLNCQQEGELRSCVCQVPFFKEIVLISFVCEHCGYKSSDLKVGGEVSEFGSKMVIKIESPEDLNRDFFKSDTSSLVIPEIGLELSQGTMGSFYSTVEGFLEKIINQLTKENPFVGDSSDKEQIKSFEKFIEIMKDCKKGKIPFTMEIDDPLDNCFIYNRHYPNPDPQVKYENYVRTQEQNQDLGIDFLIQEELLKSGVFKKKN